MDANSVKNVMVAESSMCCTGCQRHQACRPQLQSPSLGPGRACCPHGVAVLAARPKLHACSTLTPYGYVLDGVYSVARPAHDDDNHHPPCAVKKPADSRCITQQNTTCAAAAVELWHLCRAAGDLVACATLQQHAQPQHTHSSMVPCTPVCHC
jgi:hypothetical protein